VEEDVDEVGEEGQPDRAEDDVLGHASFVGPRRVGARRVDGRLTALDAFLTPPRLGSQR
jgi:hypothetical protein